MKVFLDAGRQRKLLILYLFIWNIAADCPVPRHGVDTVITNESLLINKFPDGTVITYECKVGYVKASGTGISNCVNGKWTKPDIICRKKDCGPLEAKPHMSIDTSEGTLFGAKATLTCEKGYWIFGSSYIDCLDRGWTGEGDCVLVTCPIPRKVENGQHSWKSDNKPKYKQTIRFSCNTGYRLIGHETIQCTATTEYDKGPPQCIVVTCPIPTKVKNGEHSWSSDDKPEYQQKIHFSCNTGHALIGKETIQCTATGKYDYRQPQCFVYCQMPEGGNNMFLTDKSLPRKDFPYGTRLTYKCSKGYEKASGSEIITCMGGNWTELDLICKAYCHIPKGGENLVLTDVSLLKKHFPHGTEVLYKCSNGFEKESGSENITCVEGKWTETDLICTRNTPRVAIVAIVCSIVGIFINYLVRRQ